MVPTDSDTNTFWEHVYRYAFAARFVRGQRVLDVACGTGYGSAALLAAGARSVIGVDISAESCAYAAKTFGVDARVGDAEALAFPDASFDVVVSFETIEHLQRPTRLLDECRRVLRPGGCAVISTPDKHTYDKVGGDNPHHLHEFEADEFIAACTERFPRVKLFTQCPLHAAWWSSRGFAARSWPATSMRGVDRLRSSLRRLFHPGLNDAGLLKARANPVSTIVALSRQRSTLANPYAVRPRGSRAAEKPIYLLAVVETSGSRPA